MTSSPKRSPRSGCPIASTLDLVGDRWSLVIIRDMLMGKARFAEFLASPERITTNVLTDRLAALEGAGLIERHAYQQKPMRFEYRLTARGRALLPILQAMCLWAEQHLPDCWTPPRRFMEMSAE